MLGPKEIKIKLGFINLAAMAWGNKKHKPILALHGWLDNAASFARLAPLIKNHYIIALDIPGHGKSDHFAAGRFYHFIDYVYVIDSVIEKLGYESCILLGHSMGGGISTLYAGTFSEKVEKLILIEGLGPLHATPAKGPTSLKKSISDMNAVMARRNMGFEDLERGIRLRQRAGSLSFQAAKTLVERGIRKRGKKYFWQRDTKLTVTSPLRMTEGQVNAFIKKVRAETLLIVGDTGFEFVKQQLQKRLKLLKKLQLKHLQGNHHLHLEHPKPVAKEINQFLIS